MRNLDLNNYGVQEMNVGEMNKVEGGISIIRAEGFLDGVEGNQHLWIFGIKIF